MGLTSALMLSLQYFWGVLGVGLVTARLIWSAATRPRNTTLVKVVIVGKCVEISKRIEGRLERIPGRLLSFRYCCCTTSLLFSSLQKVATFEGYSVRQTGGSPPFLFDVVKAASSNDRDCKKIDHWFVVRPNTSGKRCV